MYLLHTMNKCNSAVSREKRIFKPYVDSEVPDWTVHSEILLVCLQNH